MLSQLLALFLVLRVFQQIVESTLSYLNMKFVENPANQTEAKAVLSLSDESIQKSLAYARDRFRFGQISAWVELTYTLLFIALGGLSWVENSALNLSAQPIIQGLLVFAIIGGLSLLAGLPFSYYHTFVIEEKHGFNRQTAKGFWLDQVKALLLGAILGGLVLALLLWIMQRMGSNWWWVLASQRLGFIPLSSLLSLINSVLSKKGI